MVYSYGYGLINVGSGGGGGGGGVMVKMGKYGGGRVNKNQKRYSTNTMEMLSNGLYDGNNSMEMTMMMME